MTDIAHITAIVGEHYTHYYAAHRALREANLSAYALRMLADFSALPREGLRAQTAAACAFASMPQHAESILGESRKDGSAAATVARATICAHRGDWTAALRLFDEAAARRIEVEPAYSLALLLHTARYLFYYGAYDEAARSLDTAAAEATATLPQWQNLIGLSQCEIAARRGERTKAQSYLDRVFEPDSHLRPQEAAARATLYALIDDETGGATYATSAAASEALDRAQPALAATLLGSSRQRRKRR